MSNEHFDPLDSENVEPQGDLVQEKSDSDYKFPEEHREDFRGLNFIGALHDEFDFLGHSIAIKTLNTDETLAVTQVIKKYEGSQGFMRAYVTAMVAASIESVDGQELVIPIGSDENTTYAMIWQRFNYIKARWYPPTIDAVYSKYLVLEDRVNTILAQMGKASG